MKFYKEADKVRAICNHCRSKVDATITLRDVPFKHSDGMAKDILVGVCDVCSKVVLTPHQSSVKIGRDLKKTKKSVELRVPAHYIDILNVASNKVNIDLDESFNKHLMFYYIHFTNSERYTDDDLMILFNNECHDVKLSKRISFKTNDRLTKDIESLMMKFNFESRSELLKSIILKINHDIVQCKKSERIEELRLLAYTYSA